MHHIFFSQGFVLFSFKMSLMLSLPIVSNPSFFLNSSQRSVSDHLLRPSGQGVHANAITSAICFSLYFICLLYTSDAADEEDSVDLGGRRIIKKKKKNI